VCFERETHGTTHPPRGEGKHDDDDSARAHGPEGKGSS
jgi:hypothetical protein